MSHKVLVIGSAGYTGFEKLISKFLEERSCHIQENWSTAPDTIEEISCLNSATVVEFLKHVAVVNGYSDLSAGVQAGEAGKLKQQNSPWWDNSLWLPTPFSNPAGLKEDPTFFIGSCQALLSELHELSEMSFLGLDRQPPCYAEMRSDIRSFLRRPFDLCKVSDDCLADCVRWVWCALRDGAETAIRNNAPMWLGPG